MSNQHYFDVPFAFSGDVTAIPDPLQVGGTVSFTEGWNYNYQRNQSTDPAALPIDRSTMNWLLLQITTALQALQKETVPEFITAAQNGGTAIAYNAQARVLWSASGNAPFTAYVNILGSANSNTPSVADPGGTTTGWQISCDPISTAAQASAGTDNASIMTPLRVAQQDALRALLAGNSSQVFNVGPAVSGTQAPQLQQMTGRLINIQVFTASTTYTPTTGMTHCLVQAIGGGGSGGQASANTASQVSFGSGGASGSYGTWYLTAAQIGASQIVTIGAGGAGVTGGGNAGTATTLGALVNCQPGNYGGWNQIATSVIAANSVDAPPGSAPSGTGLLYGAAGMPGEHGLAFGTAAFNIPGRGGASPFGAGGGGNGTGGGGNGYGYGSGGGGAGSPVSGAVQKGGNGANGLMIIFEYS